MLRLGGQTLIFVLVININYHSCFLQLLAAFVTSSSVVLLELLITVICRESEHVHEDQIQKSLAAFIQRSVVIGLGRRTAGGNM